MKEEKKGLLKMAKENISHLYPKVVSMDVDMIRLTKNHFRSKIVLKTKSKSFFADKEASTYQQSLDKSCDAIKKQLEKEKVNKMHKPIKDLDPELHDHEEETGDEL